MKSMSETMTFFGSGPVAAKALALLAKDFEVEAVITKPVPEGHRGEFPVLTLAEKLGLKTFTPSNKQQLSELFTTKPVKSRVGIVIDYGIIISKDVIDYFSLGIVNSHFSLLPHWRGADPISFSVLEGDSKTGVSLMLIDEHLDTGRLITQKTLHIKPDATTPSLTEELIALSHDLLVEYLPKYVDGTVKPHLQPHPDRATYSRKLTKEDGAIEWDKPAEVIEREIRAFAGWPKSRAVLGDTEIIITAAHVVQQSGKAGIFKAQGKELIAYCGKDALSIDLLKPAGKNEMPAEAFLAGYKV